MSVIKSFIQISDPHCNITIDPLRTHDDGVVTYFSKDKDNLIRGHIGIFCNSYNKITALYGMGVDELKQKVKDNNINYLY